MPDPLDVLTAIGTGYATGAAQRKRENELIQLEQKETDLNRREKRRSELMNAMSRLASSGLFDMDTIVSAMKQIPAAVQSDIGEKMMYEGLKPRTEMTPAEKLRYMEAQTDYIKATTPKPETELDIQKKKADVEYKQAQIAYQKANQQYKKRQAVLLDQYANAKTETSKLNSLKQLERSYSDNLKQINRLLENSFLLDEAEIASLTEERTQITEDLQGVQSELATMGGIDKKKTEEPDINKSILDEIKAIREMGKK